MVRTRVVREDRDCNDPALRFFGPSSSAFRKTFPSDRFVRRSPEQSGIHAWILQYSVEWRRPAIFIRAIPPRSVATERLRANAAPIQPAERRTTQRGPRCANVCSAHQSPFRTIFVTAARRSCHRLDRGRLVGQFRMGIRPALCNYPSVTLMLSGARLAFRWGECNIELVSTNRRGCQTERRGRDNIKRMFGGFRGLPTGVSLDVFHACR